MAFRLCATFGFHLKHCLVWSYLNQLSRYLFSYFKYRISFFNNTQTAGASGGKPTWNRFILAGQTCETPHVAGILVESLPMGNGRETLYKTGKLLLRGLVDGYANGGFTGRRGRKKQISSGTNPNFEPIPLLGERGQERLHKRRPHLKLGEARYPRVLYAMEGEFEKERNETYEVFQLLSRKQRIEESLEQLHAVLSGLAARWSFGYTKSLIYFKNGFPKKHSTIDAIAEVTGKKRLDKKKSIKGTVFLDLKKAFDLYTTEYANTWNVINLSMSKMGFQNNIVLLMQLQELPKKYAWIRKSQ